MFLIYIKNKSSTRASKVEANSLRAERERVVILFNTVIIQKQIASFSIHPVYAKDSGYSAMTVKQLVNPVNDFKILEISQNTKNKQTISRTIES